MNNVKYFLCPMSKNIVDAVLQLKRNDIGILPSRRQIDYDGGYVGWNTSQLVNYIDDRLLIQRDHGGNNQGTTDDDGKKSYEIDSQYLKLIHVDPWKTCHTKEQGLEKTIEDISFIYSLNPHCHFEVGTEQSIFPMSSGDLFWFINELKNSLSEMMFNNIEYLVIQSGVGLDVFHERNTGNFSLQKLQEEVAICNEFGKKSKEHNGDFLTKEQRNTRFEHGLVSINIGPELSIFENSVYLSHFSVKEISDADRICYESGYWKKWVKTEYDMTVPGSYFRICGHYNYNKLQLPDIDIVSVLQEKISTILEP